MKVTRSTNTTKPKPDIHRLIDLQAFLLRFQAVDRVILLPGSDRTENDVEHSYHLALAAWFLVQYFPHLDANKAIRYAMVHDLIEVHAGDTYALAKDGTLDTKQQREAAAFEQIKQDWPDFPDMLADIAAYETHKDEEAKFVYALDKVMPVLLAYMAKGYRWDKYEVTVEELHKNKQAKVALSPEVNEYYEQLYELIQQHPEYFPKPD
jgi:5'-deoxynucleotidase YfbR-like HD superfamily hydrolase